MNPANLQPATLRHLAAVIERHDPERVARQSLTEEGIEKLATILMAGSQPTVGFFRRYRRREP